MVSGADAVSGTCGGTDALGADPARRGVRGCQLAAADRGVPSLSLWAGVAANPIVPQARPDVFAASGQPRRVPPVPGIYLLAGIARAGRPP